MNAIPFWDTTVDELKQGFKVNDDTYTCLLCGETFQQGLIYNINNTLCDAKKAAETHIATLHPSVFEYFLGFGRVYTGLSEGNKGLAKLLYKGYTYKEILEFTGANCISTVRNQRFVLREKYKQAKILVALMELMEEKRLELKQERKAQSDENLIDFHPGATCIDDRFAITQKERDDILNRYFDEDGQLVIKNFPAKEKKKIIIMQKIMENFELNHVYSEKEVNEILQAYYEDFVTIRRYLIQYGFLVRDKNGTNYRINTDV
ncbi:MAG: DUF2087 domain-containing protein [Firmicutes bacterium]|nr:DUF2087 domain-containing protein [Bacillota bacterium]